MIDFGNIKIRLDNASDTISEIEQKISELEIFTQKLESYKKDINSHIRGLKNRKNILRRRVNFYKNRFKLKTSQKVAVVNQRPIDSVEKQVIDVICSKHGISFESITSDKRDKNLQICRKEIYKELYEKYWRWFERIWFLFNRHHASIMYMHYGKHKKELNTC